MTYIISKNGEYVNRIVADEEFVRQAFPPADGYTYEVVPESEPEPTPEPPEPTEEDDVNGMLVDHEYRLTLLELGITEEV